MTSKHLPITILALFVLMSGLSSTALAQHSETVTRNTAPIVAPDTATTIAVGSTLALTLGGVGLMASSLSENGDLDNQEMMLAGTGLLTVGLSVAPSMGLFLSNDWEYGLVSTSGRLIIVAGGLTSAFMGTIMIKSECPVSVVVSTPCTNRDEEKESGRQLLRLGAALGVSAAVWAIYDLWQTPEVAHRQQKRSERALSLSIAPIKDGGALLIGGPLP